jgi:hypothetical protein
LTLRQRYVTGVPTGAVTPTRRSVLTLLALGTVGLAGCVGEDSPATDDDRSPTTDDGAPSGDDGPNGSSGSNGSTGGNDGGGNDSGGTRPRGTGGPAVAVVDTDSPGDRVEHRLAVRRAAATPTHPPRMRISATNRGSETLALGDSRDVLFAYRYDTADRLVVLPASDDYGAVPDCWRLTDPVAVTEEYRVTTLAPGETVQRDLDLYAAPSGDACLPVGEFRFETSFDVATADEGLGSDDSTRSTWGFSLSLE